MKFKWLNILCTNLQYYSTYPKVQIYAANTYL